MPEKLGALFAAPLKLTETLEPGVEVEYTAKSWPPPLPPPEPARQEPLIEKHPPERLKPFDAVEVADDEVRLSALAENPFVNVDVAL